MFVVKRIVLDNQRLAYYISTSTVLKCDKPDKPRQVLQNFFKGDDNVRKTKQKLKYPEKSVSPEDKKKLKEALNSLLEDQPPDNDSKPKHLSDLLNTQISKKEKKKKEKESLSKRLLDAAEHVAQAIEKDEQNVEKIKIDLISKLKTLEVVDEQPEEESKVEFQVPKRPAMEDVIKELKKLFGENRMNIFEKPIEAKPAVKLNIWDKLEEEALEFQTKNPPRNQFEEWIMWTEQGKLWHFPIDNDQGNEREANTDFTEHVFLDKHLEPWCPKKGPLKKFMDLVLVGLSKNPYLTVEEKKEHIFWYRDYFEKKKKLLQELGALGPAKEIEESKNPEKAV